MYSSKSARNFSDLSPADQLAIGPKIIDYLTRLLCADLLADVHIPASKVKHTVNHVSWRGHGTEDNQ
jgi:hypothetical protein